MCVCVYVCVHISVYVCTYVYTNLPAVEGVVLQCVVECCRVLQCVAVCCSVVADGEPTGVVIYAYMCTRICTYIYRCICT